MVQQLCVGTGVDSKEVRDEQGQPARPIRTRWVLCNKGDTERPEIRARLVAREVNTYKDETGMFAAATPPLEAKRMLLS